MSRPNRHLARRNEGHGRSQPSQSAPAGFSRHKDQRPALRSRRVCRRRRGRPCNGHHHGPHACPLADSSSLDGDVNTMGPDRRRPLPGTRAGLPLRRPRGRLNPTAASRQCDGAPSPGSQVKAIVPATVTGRPILAFRAAARCEPYDSFALRAVTAASAIAWPRLSASSSDGALRTADALLLAISGRLAITRLSSGVLAGVVRSFRAEEVANAEATNARRAVKAGASGSCDRAAESPQPSAVGDGSRNRLGETVSPLI
jgi:hypothetical protein